MAGRRGALGLVCVVLVEGSFPPAALAQEEQDWRQHYQRGLELFNDQRTVTQSLAELSLAYDLHPRPEILLTMARAYASLDRPVDALGALEKALNENRDFGRIGRVPYDEEMARVAARIATLRIQVEPAGARVSVNGRELGTSPLTGDVRVAAGHAHRVEARKVGYLPSSREVTPPARESVDIALVLEADPSAQQTALPELLPSRRSDDRSLGAVVAVLAVHSVGLEQVRVAGQDVPIGRPRWTQGSGIVLDPAGLIATSRALVHGADVVMVVAPGLETALRAKLVYSDPSRGFALLKVRALLDDFVSLPTARAARDPGAGGRLRLATARTGPDGLEVMGEAVVAGPERAGAPSVRVSDQRPVLGAPIFNADGGLAGLVVEMGSPARVAPVSGLVSTHLEVVIPSNLLFLAERDMTGEEWATRELVAEIAWRLILTASSRRAAFDTAVLPASWSESYIARVEGSAEGAGSGDAELAAAYLWDGAAAFLVRARSVDPTRLSAHQQQQYSRLYRGATGILTTATTARPELRERSQFVAHVLHLEDVARAPAPVRLERHPPAPPAPDDPARWVELGMGGAAFFRSPLQEGLGDLAGWSVQGAFWVAVPVARPAHWLRFEALPGLVAGYSRRPEWPTGDGGPETLGDVAASLEVGARARFGGAAGGFLCASWSPTLRLAVPDDLEATLGLLGLDVRSGVFIDRALAIAASYRAVRWQSAAGGGFQEGSLWLTFWTG